MTSSLTFRLWSSENQMVGVGSKSRRTKPITKRGNVHCDWFILPLLLSTPTTWFSLDHKRNVSDGLVSRVGRPMETFWFFLFRFRLLRLRSSENWVVGVANKRGRTKPITKCGNMHCDWFILPLLLRTPTIWFSLDHKRNVSDGVVSGVGRKCKFSYSSDSDSDFWFSVGHRRSYYDSAYDSDSVASENSPLNCFGGFVRYQFSKNNQKDNGALSI